jgi:hypothetical protein
MPQLPTHIFGMHDPGAEALFTSAGKTGWVLVSVQVNPPDQDGDFSALVSAGLRPIVRLNNGYGEAGTIPFAAQYNTFAQQCAAFVAGSKGAQIWVIGNETNSGWERPGNSDGSGGEVITPALYAQCFAKCRAEIKKVAGHASDWVVPSAPAPWNPQTTYSGNANGDWVKYFQDVLNQCAQWNAKPDALSIHTYTHGLDPSLVTVNRPMDPPFQNRQFDFRAYRDFLSVVPAAMKSLPVLITETQAQFWENRDVGWIRAAFKEINDWNSIQANQPIQALVLFRWQDQPGDPDGWSISNRPSLVNDFRAALQNDYRVRLPTQPPPDPVAAAAIAKAKTLTWMPINDQAALYKFAQANNLGYPQTDEFEFTFNSAGYVAQVFNLGIVYVKKGDWGNVKWVKKPAT